MIAEGLHGGPGAAARMCAMLSEEALIVLAAFGACALLVLGILELVWPTRPKHPARDRASVVPRAARPHRQSALTRHARERTRPYARRQPDPVAPLAPSVEPVPLADAPLEPVAESPADVVAGSPLEPVAASPASVAANVQRQLASLAESVAQGLLAEAERQAGPASEERLATIRSAVAWLERGMVAAPADAALAELAASAQAMLWPAWERTVMALAQRQEFRTARRLLREALADPGFPAAHAETFKELFSGTFSGEIGQLTAQAIRSMQEARESDALASLQRAETLLDTLNAEALPPSRREEVDRRLWWGYNKLGTRRVEAGQHEDALEPLFHALGYDVGPTRRQETVALLVRALDGVADARALAVRELADGGDREA